MTDPFLRPFAASDVPDLVRIWNEMAEADGMNERRGLDQFAVIYRTVTPTFDPWADVVVAEMSGHSVGYARHQWVDTADGIREHRVWTFVGPSWRDALAGRLQDAVEERALAVAALQGPIDRPRALGSWALDTQAWRRQLLEARGFSPVRWSFQMERATLDGIVDVPPPEDIRLRAADADEIGLRRVWDASGEAFEDHWGGIDRSEAAFQAWRDDPYTDPALFVIAWAGDEVVGGVLPIVNAAENQALGVNRGWIMSVFVRRPWRRRGIGAALVAAALRRLGERGLTGAILTVDADNPTGALGVYERAGFAVTGREISYRRPLMSGLTPVAESG